LSPAGKPRRPLVALSTASVFPDRTPDAFEVAARLGYDGVEVMVSADVVSQDVDVLRRLADYHGVPVLAIHAPCLLITQRVWGREPWGKLVKSAAVAQKLGARTVVVHPPFRWQRDYARDFAAGLARLREETGIIFAVENMYPLRAGGAEVAPYAPHWNPVAQDYEAVTLDLSHTSVSGSDAMAMAAGLGGRLAHVHMADGTGLTNRDEHLVPGRGTQPCGPLLEKLAAGGYTGVIVLEVNTRRAATRDVRRADLAEALDFTRRHLALGDASPNEPASGQRGASGQQPAGPGGQQPAGPGRPLDGPPVEGAARQSVEPHGSPREGAARPGMSPDGIHLGAPGGMATEATADGSAPGGWRRLAARADGARRMAGRVRDLGRVATGRAVTGPTATGGAVTGPTATGGAVTGGAVTGGTVTGGTEGTPTAAGRTESPATAATGNGAGTAVQGYAGDGGASARQVPAAPQGFPPPGQSPAAHQGVSPAGPV
jgi:sugar phosphate isomerase/epimerase